MMTDIKKQPYDVDDRYLGNRILLPKLSNKWKATFAHDDTDLTVFANQLIHTTRPTQHNSLNDINGIITMTFEDDAFNVLSSTLQDLMQSQLQKPDHITIELSILDSDVILERFILETVYISTISYSDLDYAEEVANKIEVEFRHGRVGRVFS